MDALMLEQKCECENCARLFAWWEENDKSEYAYWVATEIFVAMHGGDVCNAPQP